MSRDQKKSSKLSLHKSAIRTLAVRSGVQTGQTTSIPTMVHSCNTQCGFTTGCPKTQ